MDELIKAVATALDLVESDLLGASTNHGKRVAVLCALMGKQWDLDEETLQALIACAFFHDNALTEYIQYRKAAKHTDGQELHMRLHCEYGQRNMDTLPFAADINGLILYHHERADGTGLFGKKEGEIPLGAELIAIADMVDVTFRLQQILPEGLPVLRNSIELDRGKRYTKRAADAMLSVLDTDTLLSLDDSRIHETAANTLPVWYADMEGPAIMRLADLAARIIDCKSAFTRKHSVQIANRVWLMGGYYGFDPATRAKAYLAAALHDIGKLAVPSDILEKPGKLTDGEFNIIKQHAKGTYDILCGISGFEDICSWASDHHEKLDGTGYCFGKNAEGLDFIARLMACTDIYQAVSEERPYHPARSHEETMPILQSMANSGYIDAKITQDFNTVMAEFSLKDIPLPDNILGSENI
jgi:HD-GYP domain-containing protein (c-di-GMP phosphodiesterase class II)